jgi:predicted ribosome quality control (RQC) complex YloA/Tae2 family protein
MELFFNEIDYISLKMKRKLSSFDIYVIASDLQEIMGSYIDNIYQLTRDDLLIRIKNIHINQKEKIFARNGEFICTTQKQMETPAKPSTFAMTLRKYLLNGIITGIFQHEFDRILKIKISKKEGDYLLIFEFFSEGNIILVNPDGKIILPLISQEWAHRRIKGNSPYMPPPSQTNPFNLTKNEFINLLIDSKADLVRTLAVNVNLSGPIAEEICKRADVDKTVKTDNLDDNTISKVFTALSDFLILFKDKNFDPNIVKKDGNIIEVLPVIFERYKNNDIEQIEKFSRSLEVLIDIEKPERKKTSEIEKKISKLNRQLTQQLETTKELNKNIKQKKLEGDLIYLNYQSVENILTEIKNILEIKDKESIISEINQREIVKEFDPIENLLILSLKDINGRIFDIKISFRKSVSENAEKAYDDNKKLRKKLDGALKSIEKTKLLINKTEEKVEIEKEKEKASSKKEKILWFEKYRWFISSDGNIIVGGRDAKSNELVVKKYLKQGDFYAHADVQGAPSIIIKNRGVNNEVISISDETLEEACIFAACYSKAWKQFAEAQAYWVLPEQVSKTAQSGEFVPKGAFIIRGKRNYYRCKLEVAIGEIIILGEKKIMTGPINSVKSQAKKYVILQPGEDKKSFIAKKLAKAFDVDINAVDRVLPAGNLTVIKTVGVDL